VPGLGARLVAMPVARYDGLAEWYDAEQSRLAQRPDSPIDEFAALVGPGHGLFVEIGCGTGLTAAAVAAQGWSVVGVDVSADQLSLAQSRCRALVRADAHALPFRTASVPAVGFAFVHTDVDAFDQVMLEVGRVLAPGARCTGLGVHPCFVGHHVDSPSKGDTHLGFVAGYREARRVDDSEQFGPGIRSRVGARHVPLGPLLSAFIAAGLVLDGVVERGDGIVPWMLGVSAHKP
jgi:SAM-dependent methyltransferase